MSKLNGLTKAADEIAAQMYDDIVEFLKQHNRLVRTDNEERSNNGLDRCYSIFDISMDGDDEPDTEKVVLAVALIGENDIAVLPNYGSETISGLTDQEVLECNNWEWINNGYVHRIATLYSICENIEQYV